MASTKRARIFISYKRVEPDFSVAREVFAALRQQHDVFIDQIIPVSVRWGERIEAEIRQADVFIAFLSADSIGSEMIVTEISTAHQLTKSQGGRPVILPIRLAYRAPFPYPLSVYLDAINWAFWQDPADTPRLITELMYAVSGEALPIGTTQAKSGLLQGNATPSLSPPSASAPLEIPEGTMELQSRFYVERPSDHTALAAIERQGVTISIIAPRQMGKSSLLMRIVDAAKRQGKRVALLDFQLFEKAALADATIFFRQFCFWLTLEVGVENRLDDYWQAPLGNMQCCTRYMGRHLLPKLGSPLVLALDEVEIIFDTDFRADFFGMLRSWHNSRAGAPIWKQLDLALVTSTEPYQLIGDLNQSPFNVGTQIKLRDFTPEQVADLNHRHGSPLHPDQIQECIVLFGGQPYLVRQALYLVASGQMSAAELFTHAADDGGPFDDHLRYHFFPLHDRENLLQGLHQVLSENTCKDEAAYRLHSAGLVRREGRTVLPRCRLYADYFREHLRG
jgi:AAA-like domain/TIR domain